MLLTNNMKVSEVLGHITFMTESCPRHQESYGNRLIMKESVTKQRPMSGRKIVGSTIKGLISILYCESPQAVSWSPLPTSKEWLAGGEGAEMEEGLQRARRGMQKVKEDSFTKAGMVLWYRGGAEGG
ncbi:unnamed protein product [Menidia menidia]|uniref:(Atlantic silverside) hypothetical protein n=1 Tax=Menidia menidia TaxID=238744 RepID=A0A8S4AXN2_9TELE|nr:unnamed protein product [Menidia menidia]